MENKILKKFFIIKNLKFIIEAKTIIIKKNINYMTKLQKNDRKARIV